MKAGRELDALVAEKVMGFKLAQVDEAWTVEDWLSSDYPTERNTTAIITNETWRPGDSAPQHLVIPHYSTDIAVAWSIIDRLLEMPGEDGHFRKEAFIMNIPEQAMGELVRWRSNHAAHIICIAALMAFGVEV